MSAPAGSRVACPNMLEDGDDGIGSDSDAVIDGCADELIKRLTAFEVEEVVVGIAQAAGRDPRMHSGRTHFHGPTDTVRAAKTGDDGGQQVLRQMRTQFPDAAPMARPLAGRVRRFVRARQPDKSRLETTGAISWSRRVAQRGDSCTAIASKSRRVDVLSIRVIFAGRSACD